jgi:hypothetical protein
VLAFVVEDERRVLAPLFINHSSGDRVQHNDSFLAVLGLELIVPRHDEALLLICRSVNRMLVSCPVFQPGHSHSMNQDNASYLSNALLKAVGI